VDDLRHMERKSVGPRLLLLTFCGQICNSNKNGGKGGGGGGGGGDGATNSFQTASISTRRACASNTTRR